MCNTCATLAARNEELEAEVASLKTDLYGWTWEAPPELKLTPVEYRLVAVMLRHTHALSHDFIFDATRGSRTKTDVPSTSLISTLICHLRARLRPFGLEVTTVWGRGYRLTDESRNRLLHWNTQTTQAA